MAVNDNERPVRPGTIAPGRAAPAAPMCDGVRGNEPGAIGSRGPRLSRRQFVALGAVGVVAASVGLVAWGNVALQLTRLTLVSELVPAAFAGYRIAHVSDLHNDQFGPGNRDLLALLDQVAPDLIAITGDLVDSYRADVDVAASFVESALGLAPVACVTGNHEVRLSIRDPQIYAPYEQRLADAGALMLHDVVVPLERSGQSLLLAGADDPSQNPATRSEGSESAGMALRLAGMGFTSRGLSGAEGSFSLLLSHRPELFSTYCAAGIDLALTGHAHGGQFRLPFVGGLYAPNQGIFPRYDAGLYTAASGDSGAALGRTTSMVVSRGLGNSSFPVRFNNRPELVVVELQTA